MKLSKTLGIAVCAGLLSAGVLGSSPRTFAQDAEEGAWGTAATANPDESSSPEAKAPPLSIGGCWEGPVNDTADGTGTLFFGFVQSSNGKQLTHSSSFDFEWPDQSFAHGAMKGTVTSKGFKFKGNAGKGCPVSGSGKGDESGMTGTAKFGGGCAKFFKNVTFSITPGCI
jgi:hypothetical protein